MSEKGRLLGHFQDASLSTQGSRWAELWTSGEQALWDRGRPSPALLEYLQSPECLILATGNRGIPRALVPACGTGYDVVALAKAGFEAWGLEISERAVQVAEDYARKSKLDTASTNVQQHAPDERACHAKFILGDFFAHEWQSSLPFEPVKFDLVYDYTFLCALLPETRKAWAQRMADLVKPGKFLICLEFPLWKDLRLPGPPWGLEGVYWDLLAEGGDGLVNDKSESRTGSTKGKFDRVQYLQPTESFQQGRGTDMLSVWRRKDAD